VLWGKNRLELVSSEVRPKKRTEDDFWSFLKMHRFMFIISIMD